MTIFRILKWFTTDTKLQLKTTLPYFDFAIDKIRIIGYIIRVECGFAVILQFVKKISNYAEQNAKIHV